MVVVVMVSSTGGSGSSSSSSSSNSSSGSFGSNICSAHKLGPRCIFHNTKCFKLNRTLEVQDKMKE